MALIYSSTNKISINDISDRYNVPKALRGELSRVHSDLLMNAMPYYRNTTKFKQQVVDALNLLTYFVFTDQAPPFSWSSSDPLGSMPTDYDRDEVLSELGDLALTIDGIEWDVDESFCSSDVDAAEERDLNIPAIQRRSTVQITQPAPLVMKTEETANVKHDAVDEDKSTQDADSWNEPTKKEDLYLEPPKFPRFDATKPWMSLMVDNQPFVIYTTLPEIPTTQQQISVSTDVTRMTDTELLRLYPNRPMKTRPLMMYEPLDGFDYPVDEDLGVIYPIIGFTEEQVRDNIIKYPHLYQIKRLTDDKELVPFNRHVEVDGQLIGLNEAWDSLPDSKLIPRVPEAVREYLIRKYLLERDAGIEHRYPMYGTLDPFITLFMPPSFYAKYGYTDLVDLARKCVKSRVSFRQSRNPMLRRVGLYE